MNHGWSMKEIVHVQNLEYQVTRGYNAKYLRMSVSGVKYTTP